MHSCPWTGRIWCSSGCSCSSSPSTQPPQGSSRALPSSPPAALCSSLLSSLLPAQGTARARGLQSQEGFSNAHWCSLCSFRTCRRCKVPCQAMPQGGNLYQRHKTLCKPYFPAWFHAESSGASVLLSPPFLSFWAHQIRGYRLETNQARCWLPLAGILTTVFLFSIPLGLTQGQALT